MRSPSARRLALALVSGVAACASVEETTRLGYVVAPSIPAERAAAPPTYAVDAGPSGYRPLPPEAISLGCAREVLCQEQAEEVPPLPFPPPFDRCAEQYGKDHPRAQLSALETRRARHGDPAACCYVELGSCVGRPPR